MKRNTIILAIALLVIVIVSVYAILQGETQNNLYITVGWILAILILLWIGNQAISHMFDSRFPWLRFGGRRFFFHLTTGIFYSLAIINLAYYIFKVFLTQDPPSSDQIIVMNAYGFILFIPFFSIYFSLQFLSKWQKSEVESEKFQKESIKSELNSLKNHLDPHFLFNNLNILSSLIDIDTEKSQVFLGMFAEVYRKILLTKSEELITLEEEMEFLNSYMYLINTRFENNIIYEFDLSMDADVKMIPPLTVQMLVENAIKHNIITIKEPLRITIKDIDDYLVIENTLKIKPEEIKGKSGTGLINIQARFQFFTDRKLIIEKTDTHFTIQVPLLEIETI